MTRKRPSSNGEEIEKTTKFRKQKHRDSNETEIATRPEIVTILRIRRILNENKSKTALDRDGNCAETKTKLRRR